MLANKEDLSLVSFNAMGGYGCVNDQRDHCMQGEERLKGYLGEVRMANG